MLASGGHLVCGQPFGLASVPRLAPCCSVVTRSGGQIERALATARSGASATLALVGEPGIGKTALLDHAAERADRDAGPPRARDRVRGADPVRVAARAAPPGAPACSTHIPEPQAAALEGALALRPGRRRSGSRSARRRSACWPPTPSSARSRCWSTTPTGSTSPSAQALLFAFRRLVADPIAVLIAVREGEPSLLDGSDLPTLRLGGLTSERGGDAAAAGVRRTRQAAARRHGRQSARAARARARTRVRSRSRPTGAPVLVSAAHLPRVPAPGGRAR